MLPESFIVVAKLGHGLRLKKTLFERSGYPSFKETSTGYMAIILLEIVNNHYHFSCFAK